MEQNELSLLQKYHDSGRSSTGKLSKTDTILTAESAGIGCEGWTIVRPARSRQF